MGLGKLGSMVAKVGKAFGMEVIAWSENLKMAEAEKHGVMAEPKMNYLKNQIF